MNYAKKAARVASALTVAATLVGGAAAAETVKLGFSGPLSGGAALYGQNALSGVQMAIDEINQAGGYDICGKKYDFEVVALDDKYSPSETAINAKRLVQQEQVPVVFVPHAGGSFALQAFNEREGVILASYTSVPEVTARGNKLTVRIPPNYKDYVQPFLNYTQERFGNKLGVLNATHTYGKLWSDAFVPAWEDAGGEVVSDNPMDYNRSTDFYTGVSKVLAANPDVLLIGGASEPTALVAKQARELGFKGGFVVMDQAKLDEMANVTGSVETLEGAIGVMPLIYDEDPAAKQFVEAFRERSQKDPSSEIGYHYTTTYVFAEAMDQACSTTDAEKIRAAIPKAITSMAPEHNVQGLTGISDGGALESDPQLATVEEGKVVPKQMSALAKKN